MKHYTIKPIKWSGSLHEHSCWLWYANPRSGVELAFMWRDDVGRNNGVRWSVTINDAENPYDGCEPTFEEAKAACEKCWLDWLEGCLDPGAPPE
jgi:hypothetical protein